MMSIHGAPDPLVPAEVDLQDFPFMPLHVARLRDSDLAAEEDPEACWYAVLLWAASWHQIPAASLPDNDTVLMKLVGLGRDARTWKKHRAGALRGFVLCRDGRLYHKIVAEQANEAWDGKLRQRHRTFCAAVRKHNERNPEKKLESPPFEEWLDLGRPEKVTDVAPSLSRVTGENVTRDEGQCRANIGSKGQGQGQGQGDSIGSVEADASTGAGAPKPDDPADGENGRPAPPRPVDVAKVIFDNGIRILGEVGKSEREARTMIGLWRSKHGEGAVLAALTRYDAQAPPPSEPIGWITEALHAEARKAAGNGHGKSRDNRDGVARALDRRLGLHEPPGEAGRRDAGAGGDDRGEVPGIRALR